VLIAECIRRIAWLRPLFGMKRLPSRPACNDAVVASSQGSGSVVTRA